MCNTTRCPIAQPPREQPRRREEHAERQRSGRRSREDGTRAGDGVSCQVNPFLTLSRSGERGQEGRAAIPFHYRRLYRLIATAGACFFSPRLAGGEGWGGGSRNDGLKVGDIAAAAPTTPVQRPSAFPRRPAGPPFSDRNENPPGRQHWSCAAARVAHCRDLFAADRLADDLPPPPLPRAAAVHHCERANQTPMRGIRSLTVGLLAVTPRVGDHVCIRSSSAAGSTPPATGSAPAATPPHRTRGRGFSACRGYRSR